VPNPPLEKISEPEVKPIPATESNVTRENSDTKLSTVSPSSPQELVATSHVRSALEAGALSQILISPFATTKQISLITVALLLAVLMIDAIVISKTRIARISGRSLAHISFMGMILAIIIILRAGKIV
jgi:hypothetical protein